MIGAFLRNSKDQVWFMHICDEARPIASFLYVASAGIMTVQFADGTEESFTSEIEAPIREILVKKTTLDVVTKKPTGEVLSEYEVPLTVS